MSMFQDYASLKGLEVRACESEYGDLPSDNELSLVSYFPSITSYRLVSYFLSNILRLRTPPSHVYDDTLMKILDCKDLRCLYLSIGLPRDRNCVYWIVFTAQVYNSCTLTLETLYLKKHSFV